MLVFAIVWLWPIVASAQDDLPTITVCNDCSSEFQYGQAAVQAANLFPGETEDVYVANISALETMAFRISLMTTVQPSGDLGIDISAMPISGDPAVNDDLLDAMAIIDGMKSAMVEDVPADRLELPAEIDSALDLIGPEGPEGHPASRNRRIFQNRLTEYYRDDWRQRMIGARDGVERALERFFGESGINLNGIVEVIFDDGTKVRIRVVSIDQDMSDPTEIVITFEVVEESVSAPGIDPPLRFYELSDYDEEGIADPDLAVELGELLRRLGALVEGSFGGSCSTTMTCSEVPDGAGGVETRCTATADC